MRFFDLPSEIKGLVAARNRLRDHYAMADLRFTFDGNLVGDLGEAIASRVFGLKLAPRCGTGIDGVAPDGRSVQVKASGTNRGPAFRLVDTRANHLIVLLLDFDRCVGEIVFNGPEHKLLAALPSDWIGQRMVPLGKVRSLDAAIDDCERLMRID